MNINFNLDVTVVQNRNSDDQVSTPSPFVFRGCNNRSQLTMKGFLVKP